jgi:hypothetical protein
LPKACEYDEHTLPFPFLASEVFHHLDPYLAAAEFPDVYDLAGIDADEFDSSCSHVYVSRQGSLSAFWVVKTRRAFGEVGELVSAKPPDTDIPSMQRRSTPKRYHWRAVVSRYQVSWLSEQQLKLVREVDSGAGSGR